MSKDHIPGSMDLLLDTMCNTFGGVVFIALTLALAFFVCRSQITPEDNAEKMKQELEAQRRESRTLESMRNSLAEKLAQMVKLSSQYQSAGTELPGQVAKLEQERRNRQREFELQKMAYSDFARESDRLEKENKKNEAGIREMHKKTAEKEKTQTEEYRRLCFLVDDLNEKMRQTPVKRFHFAHQEHTSNSPYVLLLKNNRLYRLGTDYHHSSKEVRVRRAGNVLVLTPVDGTLLPSISLSDLRVLLGDFKKSSSFLWIMVHPDSFGSFVVFRRLLRTLSWPVFWYIDTGSVLYLSSHASYSASH